MHRGGSKARRRSAMHGNARLLKPLPYHFALNLNPNPFQLLLNQYELSHVMLPWAQRALVLILRLRCCCNTMRH
jgi:hypothetical protein